MAIGRMISSPATSPSAMNGTENTAVASSVVPIGTRRSWTPVDGHLGAGRAGLLESPEAVDQRDRVADRDGDDQDEPGQRAHREELTRREGDEHAAGGRGGHRQQHEEGESPGAERGLEQQQHEDHSTGGDGQQAQLRVLRGERSAVDLGVVFDLERDVRDSGADVREDGTEIAAADIGGDVDVAHHAFALDDARRCRHADVGDVAEPDETRRSASRSGGPGRC